MSRDGGETWHHRKNLEDDPAYEFSNVACSYTDDGRAIVTYFTSRMANPEPRLRALPAAQLVRAGRGDLLFFYLQYCHLKWNTPLRSNGCLRRSRDGGRTWGGETRIWEQAGYGCANHTWDTRLGDGRLLKSVVSEFRQGRLTY